MDSEQRCVRETLDYIAELEEKARVLDYIARQDTLGIAVLMDLVYDNYGSEWTIVDAALHRMSLEESRI